MARSRLGIQGGIADLSHWAWALPILLVFALLGIRGVDLFPPRTDEFISMYNVGWIVGGPYSPIDALQSLAANSPDHTPLYFLLLNIWGHLVGADIATGRLLSVFAGLLSAAMIYRLTRDFVSPMAAVFAAIILASNTFFNFYLVYLRMYPLLVLNTALVCWLYLRIVGTRKTPGRQEYVALAAACYALVNTHAISVLLLIALGIYHVLHVRRDRRWLIVSLAIALALLLLSPWAVILLSAGLSQTFSSAAPTADNTREVFDSWLSIGFNGSVSMLIVTIAGLALLFLRRRMQQKQLLLLLAYFIIALALFTQFVGIIVPGTMRLTITGLALFIPCIAISLTQLFLLRRLLGLIALVWVLAGIAYQQSGEWTGFLSISGRYEELIPWHAVSREVARHDLAETTILGYQFDDFRLNWLSKIDYRQSDFYFAQHGIEVRSVEDSAGFQEAIRFRSITESAQWLMYRTMIVGATEAAELEAIMRGAYYETCSWRKLGMDTILIEYRWEALDCARPRIASTQRTEYLEYEFYGAALSANGEALLFVDTWTAKDDAPINGLKLSHQLISADWENVAQLDLPLVNENRLRQFSIDIADVPAGSYRLMAILYDGDTGERYEWMDNPSKPPYIKVLADVVIPD